MKHQRKSPVVRTGWYVIPKAPQWLGERASGSVTQDPPRRETFSEEGSQGQLRGGPSQERQGLDMDWDGRSSQQMSTILVCLCFGELCG